MEPLPQGIKNLNYRVRAGGQEWVLKCHPGCWRRGRLAFSHRLELRLANAGLPSRRSCTTSQAARSRRYRRASSRCTAWVRGQQIAIDPRDLAHDQHPRWPAAGFDARSATSGGADLRPHGAGAMLSVDALLPVPGGLWRASGTVARTGSARSLRLRLPRPSLDKWILAHLAGLYRHALPCPPPPSPAGRRLDIVLAHNDLNWENLVFGDELDVLPSSTSTTPASCHVRSTSGRRLSSWSDRMYGGSTTSCRLRRGCRGAGRLCGGAVRDAVEVSALLALVDRLLPERTCCRPGLVAAWCSHLHACLTRLPDGAAPGVHEFTGCPAWASTDGVGSAPVWSGPTARSARTAAQCTRRPARALDVSLTRTAAQ